MSEKPYDLLIRGGRAIRGAGGADTRDGGDRWRRPGAGGRGFPDVLAGGTFQCAGVSPGNHVADIRRIHGCGGGGAAGAERGLPGAPRGGALWGPWGRGGGAGSSGRGGGGDREGGGGRAAGADIAPQSSRPRELGPDEGLHSPYRAVAIGRGRRRVRR